MFNQANRRKIMAWLLIKSVFISKSRLFLSCLVLLISQPGYSQQNAGQDLPIQPQAAIAEANQASTPTIDSRIASTQAALQASKQYLERLVIEVLPALQSEINLNSSLAETLQAQTGARNPELDNSTKTLTRTKDQLIRTQRILQSKQQELAESQQQAILLDEKIRSSESNLNAQASSNNQIQSEIVSIDAQIDAVTNERDRVNQQILALEQELKRREIQAGQLESNEASFRQTRSDKSKQLASLKADKSRLERSYTTKVKDVESEQANWAKIDQSIAERQQKIQGLDTQISEQQQQLEKLNERGPGLDGELSELKAKTMAKKEELTTVKSQVVELRKTLKIKQKEVQSAKRELRTGETNKDREIAAIQRLTREIDENQNTIIDLKRDESNMLQEIKQLDALLKQKNQSIEPLLQEIEKLKAEKQLGLEEQAAERVRSSAANEALVEAETRYQAVSKQLYALEQQRNTLIEEIKSPRN